MARLFELVANLADDEACMDQLANGCGLGSTADGRRTYEAAVGLVERRLAAIGASSAATKSLLRSARSLQQAERNDPRAQFEDGHVLGEELVDEVFGPEADPAVRALAAEQAITEDKARSVLESTTAVFMASAVDLAGEELTFESLAALLAAEPGGPAPEAGPPEADGEPSTAAGVTDAGAEAEARADVAPAPADVAPAETGVDPAPAEGPVGRAKAWLLAVPALVLLGAGVGWLTTSGDDDTTLAFTDQTTTTAVDVDPESQPAPEDRDQATAESDPAAGDGEAPAESDQASDASEAAAAESDPAAGDGEAPVESEAAAADSDPAAADGPLSVVSPPVPIGAPDRYAVMSQGKIFLRGFLESTEVEQQIVAAVEEVVGPGAVVSEYVIDPDRSVEDDDDGTPVYIEDTVLFATGSAEIAPDFVPLLGAGLRLLQVQPDVTLEVTGHTDSQGSDAVNLALSQSRVDAVKEFFVAQGIDPERVIAIGKGETEPRADNDTAEGRQANRRVEFLVKGFTYGP